MILLNWTYGSSSDMTHGLKVTSSQFSPSDILAHAHMQGSASHGSMQRSSKDLIAQHVGMELPVHIAMFLLPGRIWTTLNLLAFPVLNTVDTQQTN